MWYYLLSSLLWRLMGNPLLVLALLALAYLVIDRRFIGLLPDFTAPFRRRRHVARLVETIRLNPADANSQLELGAIHMEQGRVDRALPLLEKARARMPDSARLHSLLGACYHLLGRGAEAQKALEQAVTLNPKVGYGEPYYHLLAIGLRDKTRDRAALEEFKERILTYGSPPVFYRAGRVLLAAGDRAGARAMFGEAVENYQAAPKGFRRAYRRWAFISGIYMRFCR